MVVTRAGVSTSTNPYFPSPGEGPQVAENPRVQDPDDLTNSVTREASGSTPPVPSESICGPFMDPTHNVGSQAQSEPSSMAPMLSIIAEMQRELGELRRSKERGHGSDSEDSEDGSVSVPLVETDAVLSATELLRGLMMAWFLPCAMTHVFAESWTTVTTACTGGLIAMTRI
jgi:hypothetical protein